MLNPLVLLAAQLLLTITILGFTAPRSVIRFTALPFLTLCSALIVPRCMAHLHSSSWAALVGGYSTTFLVHFTATIISESRNPSLTKKTINEIQISNQNENHKRQESSRNLRSQFKSGLQATFTCRWSGTPREIRNVPSFSSRHPSYVPPRTVFLRRHFLLLVSCYLTLDLLGQAADPEVNALFFAPSKIPFWARLSQVSSQEIAMRIFGTLGSGLGMLCAQQGVYSLLAILFVGTGLSQPLYWRPLFGDIGDAYTMRRFWGRVWHQNNREKTCVPAQLIVFDILKVPKESFVGRQLCFFLVFLISGLLHATIDLSAGIPWRASGAVRFFYMQALGIWVEEAVRALFVDSWLGSRPVPSWAKSVGYVWVLLFLSWSWPAYMYPMLYRTREESADSFLPFSIMARVF